MSIFLIRNLLIPAGVWNLSEIDCWVCDKGFSSVQKYDETYYNPEYDFGSCDYAFDRVYRNLYKWKYKQNISYFSPK